MWEITHWSEVYYTHRHTHFLLIVKQRLWRLFPPHLWPYVMVKIHLMQQKRNSEPVFLCLFRYAALHRYSKWRITLELFTVLQKKKSTNTQQEHLKMAGNRRIVRKNGCAETQIQAIWRINILTANFLRISHQDLYKNVRIERGITLYYIAIWRTALLRLIVHISSTLNLYRRHVWRTTDLFFYIYIF